MEFNGKVVLITGAGSGIGAAAAETFYKKGATLSLIDINEEWLKKTADKISGLQNNKKNLLLTTGDLTVANVREDYVKNTLKTFGRIDILLNVAGVYFRDVITEFNLTHFQKTFSINVEAPVHLSALCTASLIKTKGSIVNVTSSLSDLAAKNFITYCATKAALDNATKSLALALGEYGVRVNSIRPGCVATNIVTSHCGKETSRSDLEQYAVQHIVKRIAEPSEIAEMMAVMASDTCSFMTATNLLFDGGFNALRADMPVIGE